MGTRAPQVGDGHGSLPKKEAAQHSAHFVLFPAAATSSAQLPCELATVCRMSTEPRRPASLHMAAPPMGTPHPENSLAQQLTQAGRVAVGDCSLSPCEGPAASRHSRGQGMEAGSGLAAWHGAFQPEGHSRRSTPVSCLSVTHWLGDIQEVT